MHAMRKKKLYFCSIQTALRARIRLTIGVAPAEDVDVDVDGAEGLIRVLLLGMPLIFDAVC